MFFGSVYTNMIYTRMISSSNHGKLNIAMKNGLFIVDLAINSGDFP
jgi:hypothetical protein